MADETVVHIGENSAEQVAYKLLNDVIAAEEYRYRSMSKDGEARAYILDTYAECLQAVRSPGRR